MKIILREDVEKLGQSGEVVDVKDGYGRNYLIPQGKAVMATKGAIQELERLKKEAARQAEFTVDQAKDLAKLLEATSSLSLLLLEKKIKFTERLPMPISQTPLKSVRSW